MVDDGRARPNSLYACALRLRPRRMLLWASLGMLLLPLAPLALAFPLALPVVILFW